MNLKVLTLLILLSVVSVSALTVTLDKSPPDYRHGDLVQVAVQCSGSSSLDFFNPQSQQIYFTLREGTATVTYNTNSDSANGKYQVNVLCADGGSQSVNFCVDAAGCTQQQPSSTAAAPTSGGGGRRCIPEWVCSTWSTCSVAGQQTRTCTDVRCNQRPRIETQFCSCQESWICSQWSGCQGGIQYRTCTDENGCGTLLLKPTETQSCVTPGGGFFQEIIQEFRPEPSYEPVKVSFFSKVFIFLKKYWLWILLPLVLVAVVLLLYFLLHKKKKKVYNFDELLNWIREEQKMGTSESDIRQILSEKTGWTNEEITSAFKMLESYGVAKGAEE